MTVRSILLDIEGTTTPIAFVHQVLFSYARSHAKDYLLKNLDSPEVIADLERLRQEHAIDEKQNEQAPPLADSTGTAEIDSVVDYIEWLIDRDRKSTGLKSLQGKIWEQGYRDGSLKSQVFPDVPAALERWNTDGLTVSIFSSGSSLAQKLLFSHTEAGDLTRFINNYFDTTVGAKGDVESYRKIAVSLSLPASDILFVSDVVRELDAARAAGMQTRLCIRPGNHPQSPIEKHQEIKTFDNLLVD